ncbi:MAG: Rrf2 family transcriptional regulator [Ignavibacteriae bacterium]|nr:Rrf2 family transcriptional regulator [Ignavibacteriota bacterium]
MPVLFSKSCEYAFQAVLYLAKTKNGKPIHLLDVASSLRIPYHFLSKVLQVLARHEIVASYKGQNGGFDLGRNATQIKLIDIVRAIDGEAFLSHCVMGFPSCGDEKPCPVHTDWKDAKGIIFKMLNEKTIEDLSKHIDDKLSVLEAMNQIQATEIASVN